MPELVRLGRGTLAVAVADKDERRGLDVLDEINRRAFGVDVRVVVNGGAEEGDHPLIDVVLAVVALPIGDAGARDGGAEPSGLSDRPHRHIAAVTPSRDPDLVFIHRKFFDELVHAGHDVAEVAVAEVADVGLREGFPLPEAAARVREEDEVAAARERHGEVIGPGPVGQHRARGPAVDLHDERVTVCGVKAARRHQPALHGEAVARPVDALRFAPERRETLVGAGDLLPSADRPRPNFRRAAEGLTDDGGGLSVAGQREAEAPEVGGSGERFRPGEERRDIPVRNIHAGEAGGAVNFLGEQDGIGGGQPGEPARRSLHAGREVAGLAARGGDDEDVAARRALVAHDPGDERDRLAVRRPARHGDLKRGLENGASLARRGADDAKFGDVPVGVARTRRGSGGEILAVGRPVVFVNVEVGGRNLADAARCDVRDGKPLLVDALLDHAGVLRHGLERPGGARRVLGEQEGDGLAVGRPARVGEKPLEARQLARRASGKLGDVELALALFCGVGKKGQTAAVGRPGDVEFGAGAGGDASRRRGGVSEVCDVNSGISADFFAETLHPGNARAVRRNRHLGEPAHRREGIEDLLNRSFSARGGGAKRRGTEGSRQKFDATVNESDFHAQQVREIWRGPRRTSPSASLRLEASLSWERRVPGRN